MEPDFIHKHIPAEEQGEKRTLLLLHGTGGSETDLISLGDQLLPGAGILSPRGKVLEHGLPRFFRRLAEGVFDQEDLRFRAYELAGFIEASADTYGFDKDKVIAVGYSNGANIAAATMLLRPDVLAEAVLFRPMVPFVPEKLPDLSGKRIFISAGRLDPIVPQENTNRLADLLRQSGADVTVHWQDAGHELTDEDVHTAREWLKNADNSHV